MQNTEDSALDNIKMNYTNLPQRGDSLEGNKRI